MTSNSAANIFKDIQGDWRDSSTAAPQRTESDAPPVDWNSLNYPPFLRLFHYDTSELPSPMARICRMLHFASLFATVALALNFIDSIIITLAYTESGINIVFSLLNMMIGIPGYTLIFYTGYRSLAMSLTGTYRTLLHLGLQLVGLFFAFYFMLSPHGPFNGYIRFSKAETVGYWIFATLCEATLWLGVVVLGFVTSWKIYRFNPYQSQESRA